MFYSENFIEWIQGRVLSRIFCLGEKSFLKKIFEPRGGEKNFLGLLGGFGGMLPQKILEI